MYKSPSFQIAEARGTLDELCAMNPGAIADRIRQTDQEIEGDYPEEIGRFQTSYASDGAEELINKAWYGNVNSLDGYTRPANVPVLNQHRPAAGL